MNSPTSCREAPGKRWKQGTNKAIPKNHLNIRNLLCKRDAIQFFCELSFCSSAGSTSVIDGFDECRIANDREKFITVLGTINRQLAGSIRILVLGCSKSDIVRDLCEYSYLSIAAHSKDLQLFFLFV